MILSPQICLFLTVISLSSCASATLKEVEEIPPPLGAKKEIVPTNEKAPAEDAAVMPESGLLQIKSVLAKYHQSKSVQMELKKRVFMALLERENISEGQLSFSKGQLRLRIDKPHPSEVIVDNNNIWLVDQLPEGSKPPIQVARVRVDKLSPQSRAKSPLAFIFRDLKVWDEFKLVGEKVADEKITYSLKPIHPKEWRNVAKLAIRLDQKGKQVLAVSYWDDLENETSWVFRKVDFDVPVSKDFFKYSPPKDITIMEY
ncbi:MAG: outer membrane lipoprotein carrier protein LolA [Pseudobdellovibrionaceae bacterium]|nr:outer membrane lipoprotein carrier protein LolA [Bdellovibrionales bacterium]USN46904.1 MAG: outer membrane lipoprotein carrier protein LolA [Pseudobdellovibrionaceae bacterium]